MTNSSGQSLRHPKRLVGQEWDKPPNSVRLLDSESSIWHAGSQTAIALKPI